MDHGPAVALMLLDVVGVEILRGATVLLLPTLVEVSIVISTTTTTNFNENCRNGGLLISKLCKQRLVWLHLKD